MATRFLTASLSFSSANINNEWCEYVCERRRQTFNKPTLHTDRLAFNFYLKPLSFAPLSCSSSLKTRPTTNILLTSYYITLKKTPSLSPSLSSVFAIIPSIFVFFLSSSSFNSFSYDLVTTLTSNLPIHQSYNI